MPLVDAVALPAALPPRSRLMAFDVGKRRLGVAISDPALGLATPIDPILRARWRDDGARIAALARYWSAGGFVVGLALNMDGSEGPSAQRCRDFARQLLAVVDLPLALWDERLSTHAAEEAMRDAGVAAGRRRAVIDSAAAAVILQDLLDAWKRRSSRSAPA